MTAIYVPATPPTPEDTAVLFTLTGGPVERPHDAAAAILWAVVHYTATDWADLGKHLGTDEQTLWNVSERLQRFHGMWQAGPGEVGAKLNANEDFLSRRNAKVIKETADAKYRAGQDEHGFSLPSAPVKADENNFIWPPDAQEPSNPAEFAAALIAAIEEAKAISYDALATTLGCGIAELMQACRNLSMNHGYDKLSSRSLHFYFEHHSDRLAALSRDTSNQP